VDPLTRHFRRAFLAAAFGFAAMAAHAQQASEAAVKAAFLYKFPGYIEWPADAATPPDSPFVIAVAGADDVAAELERIVPGRTIGPRRIVVRRLREGEPLRGVHVLFVGRADAGGRAWLRAAQSQPGLLAVADTERGLEMGAAINFVTFEDRVAFEVSLDSAERANLRISSRMLTVARRVIPRG
jgi:hypothetical protein